MVVAFVARSGKSPFYKGPGDPPGTSNRGVLLSSARHQTREIEVRVFGYNSDMYVNEEEVDAALKHLALALGTQECSIRRRR
jgi:hypothetical protein